VAQDNLRVLADRRRDGHASTYAVQLVL